MKKAALGILAHVDAGKTTLSEAMLFLAGKTKKAGRVDSGDTCLDTHPIERQRGITIFTSQAELEWGESAFDLLDTPGHVDFSAEMERTLQILDCAVLVISGTDGVQAHTETLWRLLERYGVPSFIFVTKMDVSQLGRGELMADMKKRLGGGCVDFTGTPDKDELALLDERALEKYMESGELDDSDIRELIARRRLFPCFFGSGLKIEGVDGLLDGLDRFVPRAERGAEFAARVYKISRDAQGARLTHMKLTGGALKVKSPLRYTDRKGGAVEEKADRIFVCSGAKMLPCDTVEAGSVCAVAGLSRTYPGQSLGAEAQGAEPVLEPAMSYRLSLPEGCQARVLLPKMRELEEEDPMLRVSWNEHLGEIELQIMGETQIQVLQSIIKDRFDADVQVDSGRIIYRETISAPVEGIGHFEPLRHYAEVHLLLEPLERGSGLVFAADCPEDTLDRNWQRLILTHLEEKQHLGVLTGSPLTDVKITLIAGRAHLKHTEGGDFRQATYRAVRQGLMCAESVLLEPYYSFRLEVPRPQIGRAISDLRAMNGSFEQRDGGGDSAVLEGSVPVSAMNGYMTELISYTHGRGRLSCCVDGYAPCHDAQRVIADFGYDPKGDLENTPDSVFCAHGAGFNVSWDRVREYMHVDSGFGRDKTPEEPRLCTRNLNIDEKELEAIMEREFGAIKRPMYTASKSAAETAKPQTRRRRECIIVDGYNVVFAWSALKELAESNIDAARNRLMDMLSNYRGYTKSRVVLVFDAYKIPGGEGSKNDYHGVSVAFTKAGETADMYIEKLAHDIGVNYDVRVVTNDSLVRLSALGSGVLRTSAREFENEVGWVLEQIDEIVRRSNEKSHTTKIDWKDKTNGK